MSEYIKLSANKELDRVIAKALLKSECFVNGEPYILVGIDKDGWFIIEDDDGVNDPSNYVLIPYDSAILDPRLLIGEDVPVELVYEGEWLELSSVMKNGYICQMFEKSEFRIPKQWLKEREMLEGE